MRCTQYNHDSECAANNAQDKTHKDPWQNLSQPRGDAATLKIGNYRIEEVSAPFGYVVNDKYVNISVDTDTAFETDGDTNDAIITVEYSDAPAVGELTVEK